MAELRAFPIWQILASNLNLAAGWKIYTYDAGSAGDPAYLKATYQDAGAVTEHTNPVVMDSRGDKEIYWSGNYYIKITDKNDVTIWTIDNFGISTTTSSQDINGSFELDSDSDGTPDDWTLTAYASGTITRVATNQNDGGYCLRADDGGNGGGYGISDIYRYCTPAIDIAVDWDLISSSATTRNLLEVLWYDESKVQLSGGSASTTLYDNSTTNPTSWTRYYYTTTPPAGAYYYKIKVTLCASSAASSGKWSAADYINPGEPSLRHFLSAAGSIIYAASANTAGEKAIGSQGQVLLAGSAAPEYGVTLQGFLYGMELSNGTDANHDIDFAAGGCVDSGGATSLIGSASTKQADADWAAGSAAGGMPATVAKTGTIAGASTTITGTGTAFTTEFAVNDVLYSSSNAEYRRITAIASDTSLTIDSAFTSNPSGDTAQKNGMAPNTWYHCFAIATADGATVDHGYDTQPDASNLLADATVSAASLTVYRRLGSVLTDSSGNILAFWQDGDKFQWDVKILDVNGGTTSAAANITLSIPYGVVTFPDSTMNFTSAATPINPGIIFDKPGSTGFTPNVYDVQTGASMSTNNHYVSFPVRGVASDTQSQIHYQTTHSGYSYEMNSFGYVDLRGR